MANGCLKELWAVTDALAGAVTRLSLPVPCTAQYRLFPVSQRQAYRQSLQWQRGDNRLGYADHQQPPHLIPSLFIPTGGPSPATHCSPNAWHCFILLLLCCNIPLHHPQNNPVPILPCAFLPSPSPHTYIFCLNQLLQLSPV